MSAPSTTVDPPRPRVATPADVPVVTRILVDAFRDDPMWGAWAFPDPRTRRQAREAVFGIVVAGALPHGWVWLADDAAAALWLPPGARELTPEQESQVDAVLRDTLGERAPAVLEAFGRFEEVRPAEPHFHLTLLGTDPGHQGRGVGQWLLAATLERIDASGAAAYLEAEDALVPLYERVGFRVRSHFALPEGPTVNGMWRSPRPPGRGLTVV